MADYAREGTVSAAVFNFGYLPGGDHRLATRPETSLKALEAALGLLKEGGILCLCLYSGGDTGYAEKQALMDWLEKTGRKGVSGCALPVLQPEKGCSAAGAGGKIAAVPLYTAFNFAIMDES